MPQHDFIPFGFDRLPEDEMSRRAESFYQLMNARRSVRAFSSDPVPRALIETAIRSASTAPSGAHRQPWRFAAVSDPHIKKRIRDAAEQEERAFYEGRAPDEWLQALLPLGTSWEKTFLETAPWLVVVFEELHSQNEDGSQRMNYYTKESVGIACGLFVAALHNMGLATLTHTPSPMRFLSDILGRSAHERPYILFPVGYPAAGVEVPNIKRKDLSEICTFHVGDEADDR
ncbi:MAG TPA: nitroreductase family protein [Candidatus Krumholzibacteria bacterium]|jgi:nitroreductase